MFFFEEIIKKQTTTIFIKKNEIPNDYKSDKNLISLSKKSIYAANAG